MGALLSIVTGGLGGALLRLVPELIGLFKAKAEAKEREADRRHELAVMELQLKQQAQGAQQRLEEIRLTTEAEQAMVAIKSSVEATKPTGIWIVDVLNGLFRPAVSFWIFGLYAVWKTVAIVMVAGSAAAFSNCDGKQQCVNLLSLWGQEEWAMLTGILNFWFLGRVFDKRAGK